MRYKPCLPRHTPQNQLLALSEYAAMYLFAWSDVPWPADLPSVQEIWTPIHRRVPVDDQEKLEAEYAAQMNS